ncbi:MAG: uridine kinase [Anaerolineae bacterium]
MNSDEVIQDIIKNRGFILAVSGLDDERTTLKIVGYLGEIRGKKTKVISLIGGAASGKSTLARRVVNTLKSAGIIGTDDFLLGSREYRRRYLEGGDPLKKYGFDLLREKVNRIRNLRPGESESVPVYDEEDGTAIKIIDFDPETGQILSVDKNHYHRRVGKVEYLIVEGDFQLLANPDYQIFFHVPDDVRLRNRINRDVRQRGVVSMTETVDSFALRQRLQHRPYTLACAGNADLLITVKAIEMDAGYKYEYSFWVPVVE